MIKNIISNIEASNLSLDEKNKLFQYANNLHNQKYPVIFDVEQLGMLFNINTESVGFLLREHTIQYYISKKNGEKREVWKPDLKLKSIQKWILKNILSNASVSCSAHGFVKNKSILTNAKIHQYSQPFWVFTTDIKDFFSSISYYEIKKIFENMGYSQNVSEYLTLLTTAEGKLAQGFPTSPALSNIFLKDIDEEFQQIASRYDIRYSRYADDITFSGTHKKGYLNLIKKLKEIIHFVLSNHNLTVNNDKTRLMKHEQIKMVTGLIVSAEGIKIPQKYIRKLSKEIYYCKRFGVNEHLKYHGLETIANYKGYLIGTARFIYMVHPIIGRKFLKEINSLNWN